MNILGDFHFIRPAWLLLAPVAVWIWWRVRTAQDPLRGWRKVMEPELLDALIVGRIADPARGNANPVRTGRRIRSYSGRGGGLLAAWWLAIAVFGRTNMAAGTLALCRRSRAGDARAQGGRDDGSRRPGAESHGTWRD